VLPPTSSFLRKGPSHSGEAMNERILVGIDLDLSPATQQMLRSIGELFEQAIPQVYIILLNVIPMPQMVVAHPGFYMGQALPTLPSTWQRSQAEEVLYKARAILQEYAINPEHIQMIVRTGTPAEQITKVAREMHINLIVVGSRGNAWRYRLRRLLLGSISRTILRDTPCPVMIVNQPSYQHPSDLVAWYTDAIKRYLAEHSDSLAVLTPQEVAQFFALPNKQNPGRKEIAAATLALENLANNGILCRHNVKGELRYVND
jgi:nucleotide-binding universal stress UspA family protein